MTRREFFIQGVILALHTRSLGQAIPSGRTYRRPTRFRSLSETLSHYQTTALLVLEDGKPVFVYGDVSERSYLASVRKSLISMLYGPSVERGVIRLNWTLADVGFEDLGGLLPIEKHATIRDLMTARSGVYHPAANPGDASSRAPVRGSVRPGSYFLYNNWDFNALDAIYEKLSGRKIHHAFYEDIGQRIGLEDWDESIQPLMNETGKSFYPPHHFVLSTRDMARLGQLMLNQGQWEGKTVLTKTWVKQTTTLFTSAVDVERTSPFVAGMGYGYLWWVFDFAASWNSALRGAFTAWGVYGQFITVIPRRRMVIAHKTAVPSTRNVAAEDYFKQILPAALTSSKKSN